MNLQIALLAASSFQAARCRGGGIRQRAGNGNPIQLPVQPQGPKAAVGATALFIPSATSSRIYYIIYTLYEILQYDNHCRVHICYSSRDLMRLYGQARIALQGAAGSSHPLWCLQYHAMGRLSNRYLQLDLQMRHLLARGGRAHGATGSSFEEHKNMTSRDPDHV